MEKKTILYAFFNTIKHDKRAKYICHEIWQIFLRGDNLRYSKLNKLICSLLVCSLILASGVVFAEDNSELVDSMRSATLVKNITASTQVMHKHGNLKAVVEQLVQEGKLSREKAEQIDKFVQEKRNSNNSEQKELRKGIKHGMLKDLVDAKIINDSEAQLIRSKFRELREKSLNEKLTIMVQKGTITEAQAVKVRAYFEKVRDERTEMHRKLQNMNDEQRKAFFKEYKKDSVMDKLIEDGVLTKEQVEELRNLFKEGHKNNCQEH